MHCENCSRRVQNALNSIDGINAKVKLSRELAIKASETSRPNARIKDYKAKEIIDALGVDVRKFDPFLSHEGVVARTIMFRQQLFHIYLLYQNYMPESKASYNNLKMFIKENL